MDNVLSKRQRNERALFFYLNILGLCVSVSSTVMQYHLFIRFESVVNMTGAFVNMLTAGATIATVLLGYPLQRNFVYFVLFCDVIVTVLLDLAGRGDGTTVWPVFVLIVDYLLVMHVETKYTAGLVAVVVVWLGACAVEDTVRFGLYDVYGTVPQEERRKYFDSLVECEEYPCPVAYTRALAECAMAAGVFVADFVATRGFAVQLLKEQKEMEETISTVQEVTRLLARYDVEAVAEVLEGAALNATMHETLKTMEHNLRRYRPYLPASLFEVKEEEVVQNPLVAPPGVCADTVTVAFTDIRASTSIWEHAPEGMRNALWIHNAVMREAMQMFGGYEVKTIGDAFMITFETTSAGVNFGLLVHELLREADWPASLLMDAPICAERGHLWGGLTVRIGVNTGPVTVEENTLTGRTDYFGHTVNVAARVESTCKPGAVAIPADIWDECRLECVAVVGEVEALELKGVSEPVCVRCLWPMSLAGRRHNPLETLGGHQGLIVESMGRSLTICETLAQSHFTETATMGVVDMLVSDPGSGHALDDMSTSLFTMTVMLDQSGGALISLVGSCVCVGWNLTRATQAHAENAVRFVQRLHDGTSVAGAGLASGPVEHGDVGTRTQRFMTVMGPSVHRSWTLCEEAVDEGKVCLYEPPQGTALPASLAGRVLLHRPGVYEVLDMA